MIDPEYLISPDPCLDEFILPNTTQFMQAIGIYQIGIGIHEEYNMKIEIRK